MQADRGTTSNTYLSTVYPRSETEQRFAGKQVFLSLAVGDGGHSRRGRHDQVHLGVPLSAREVDEFLASAVLLRLGGQRIQGIALSVPCALGRELGRDVLVRFPGREAAEERGGLQGRKKRVGGRSRALGGTGSGRCVQIGETNSAAFDVVRFAVLVEAGGWILGYSDTAAVSEDLKMGKNGER